MVKFKAGQTVTRASLTSLLCQEEIQAGLLSEEELMLPSIVEGRFSEYTKKKFRVKWTDSECKNGIIEAIPAITQKEVEETQVDTSEYEEC